MARVWITPDELAQPTHPDAGYAIEVASWILWRLSGEKYPGVGTTTEWYGYETTGCNGACFASPGDVPAHSYHVYFDRGWSGGSRQLRLRNNPVVSIASVKEGDTQLATDEYFLVNSAYIVRRDCGWDVNRGIEVTYSYGSLPPLAGKNAAAKLADELLLAFSGSDECKLPDRVSSVSRQGVSYTILDPQEFLKDGRTGIYEIDLFLQAANPARAHKKPKVFSPDKPRGEYRRV